ncbi:MAG TPA: DUF2071 domain-containing protein [Fimbriimonadaceae bacterium]|nr:DUF2071 domain-containing protein [Fimbriimonadaceae bacterium]
MGSLLDPELQFALHARPSHGRAMLHKWRDLSFLHFPIEPSVIQGMLPAGLTVDTFDGMAWVGLVPFWMTGIRFPFAPPLPGFHTFPETNVRTYVHQDGIMPGVWFFSLDAANRLAVWGARKFFGLPYFLSEMEVRRERESIHYLAKRKSDGAGHDIRVELGSPLPESKPGTLEFFLIERYLLYANRPGGLFTGIVHHHPYELRSIQLVDEEENLLAANGLPERPFVHMCYSPGVDVEVFGIRAARDILPGNDVSNPTD